MTQGSRCGWGREATLHPNWTRGHQQPPRSSHEKRPAVRAAQRLGRCCPLAGGLGGAGWSGPRDRTRMRGRRGAPGGESPCPGHSPIALSACPRVRGHRHEESPVRRAAPRRTAGLSSCRPVTRLLAPVRRLVLVTQLPQCQSGGAPRASQGLTEQER